MNRHTILDVCSFTGTGFIYCYRFQLMIAVNMVKGSSEKPDQLQAFIFVWLMILTRDGGEVGCKIHVIFCIYTTAEVFNKIQSVPGEKE